MRESAAAETKPMPARIQSTRNSMSRVAKGLTALAIAGIALLLVGQGHRFYWFVPTDNYAAASILTVIAALLFVDVGLPSVPVAIVALTIAGFLLFDPGERCSIWPTVCEPRAVGLSWYFQRVVLLGGAAAVVIWMGRRRRST